YLRAVALGGELAVPCTPNPLHGRLNSHQRLRVLVASASHPVLKVGSRASQRREPGQVRKEAALSGERQCRGVTWPEPAVRMAPRSEESMVGCATALSRPAAGPIVWIPREGSAPERAMMGCSFGPG